MTITITQGNTQENINSSIITKLYNLAINPNNTVQYSGNLYSPSGYGNMIDYLNTTFSPNLTITVPTSGRFIQFLSSESSLESTIKTFLGISQDAGITETDAADAMFTSSTFAGSYGNPNTSITSFSTFRYFTKANNNPPQNLFNYCTNLTTIDLSNVTKTSQYEFASTGLVGDLSIPNLTSLGAQSFGNTKISTVSNLGNSITSIPNYCFRDCSNLTSVTIPTTVTSIGQWAFSAEGTTYTKVFTSITGLDNVTEYGAKAFCSQSALSINASAISSASIIRNASFSGVPITGNLNLKDLLILEEYAFQYNHLSEIVRLNAITSIPRGCFRADASDSSKNILTKVYLPKNCTSIGSNAFQNRTGLSIVKKYTTDTWVDDNTPPSYTTLYNITEFGDPDPNSQLPQYNVVTFNDYCFQYCSQLQLGQDDVYAARTIGKGAFQNSGFSASALSLPYLTSIGENAFSGCSIQTISDLGRITTLPSGVFYNCNNLTSVVLPSGLTICHMDSFKETQVDRVILPEGVTEAYWGQPQTQGPSPTYLELPSTVTKMGTFFHNPYGAGPSGKILVIKATNPPEMTYYKDNTTATERGVSKFSAIYVPNLSNYTTNPQGAWANSEVQNKLKVISDLATDSPNQWWPVYQSGLSNS